jgi:cystine transport system substrate-binding protein
MSEDRLHRWLEAADQPLAPDAQFAVELRDALRQELGHIPTGMVTPWSVRRARGRVHTRRQSLGLLFAAALLVSGAIAGAAVAGRFLNRSIDQPPTLMNEIHGTGRIRIAIRPDHPQFGVPGQPAAGFDADVARALGEHLGVRTELVFLDASSILSAPADAQWDVALPSVARWQVDTSRFLVGVPYYFWPHRLVVADTSTAIGVADLAGDRVCAVAGDAGESWLRGRYGGVAASPLPLRVITRARDEECLSALSAGDAVAVVTARLSDADLQVRSGIKVIGGPDPEPRAAIVLTTRKGAPEAVSALDAALGTMRADGTLTRLSENRFGGADLSVP